MLNLLGLFSETINDFHSLPSEQLKNLSWQENEALGRRDRIEPRG